MKYLFLISIGPVQGFIASARRTRDLWFGSWLLSELSKAAAKKIVDIYGLNSLIFPAPSKEKLLDPDSDLNAANKIVALIDHLPADVGKKVHEAIEGRLHIIRDKAFTGIGSFYQDAAYKQIDDLVEYLWVALPYEGTNYVAVRKNLEALMAARKNTRDFRKVEWGSEAYKSSIDGQLESVIPEKLYRRRGLSAEEQQRKIKELYDNYNAGPAERLSGIDLLKRRGNARGEAHFPSTSHIAALPFLKRLTYLEDPEPAREKFFAYIEKIKEIAKTQKQVVMLDTIPNRYAYWEHAILDTYDGSLLFEERLVDIVTDTTGFEAAKEVLRAFYKHVDETLGKARPIPYYAILRADGDRMGKVIDNQAEQGEKQHQALSKALNTFAGGVRNIVEEKYQGALVYAGGDDVLALMPLHTLLQCTKELADNFRQELNEFKDDNGNSPTLSAGIVIVHHLYSLQDALKLAQETEDRAKKVPGNPGKDALAITISKRSGDDYTIADKWDTLYSHLEHLIDYCYRGAIPEGTAYELRDMALRLAVTDVHPDYTTVQEVILADAKRILERKMHFAERNQKKDSEQTKKILALLQDRLGIAREYDENEAIETITVDVAVEQFINELIIAQTLADVKKLTEPKKE